MLFQKHSEHAKVLQIKIWSKKKATWTSFAGICWIFWREFCCANIIPQHAANLSRKRKKEIDKKSQCLPNQETKNRKEPQKKCVSVHPTPHLSNQPRQPPAHRGGRGSPAPRGPPPRNGRCDLRQPTHQVPPGRGNAAWERPSKAFI